MKQIRKARERTKPGPLFQLFAASSLDASRRMAELHAVTTVLPWKTRLLMPLIRWRGAVRLRPHPTLAQSCSVKAEGLDGPGALSNLRVARGYTDISVHLAPQDVGALALPFHGFQS